MKTLLTLPQNAASVINDLFSNDEHYFACSDPKGSHIGSGGGTAWALSEFWKENKDEKKLLIHACGQSRRFPAYSVCGKILTSLPVFRWKIGQKIDQNLLEIQERFYKKILDRVNPAQNLLIASGDVLLLSENIPANIPNADVVCVTTWIDSSVAVNHGVLFAKRSTPNELDFMLQKPSAEKIEQLLENHIFMMDTGCWILSDRAVSVLMKKCGWNGKAFTNGIPENYDFYTDFGKSLGQNPTEYDDEISSLSSAIVNLSDGKFYHYGTSRDIISSTEKIQNLITDPRLVMQKRVKVHPSIFVQNAKVQIEWKPGMKNIWIENSCIGKNWSIQSDHVITGVPENDWKINLPSGVCLDFVPLDDDKYAIRTYSIDDKFQGDLQNEKLFPVISKNELTETIEKIVHKCIDIVAEKGVEGFLEKDELLEKFDFVSADELLDIGNIKRLFSQREKFMQKDLIALAENHIKSVFYQTDLSHTALLYHKKRIELPPKISETSDFVSSMRDAMFRSQLNVLNGKDGESEEKEAFSILQNAIINAVGKSEPKYNLIDDQIVWGRSPARIDLAGGWSDTPPFSIYEGGSVVNIGINLNGQEPIQVYIRKINENKFVLRSIDTGFREDVKTFDELEEYNKVGSSFSIPKAALCLAGFSNGFSVERYCALSDHLKELGGGLEISILAAIPKGSGLGTSSIIASTLLGTLSDVCGLKWNRNEICYRTLALEQMLTTGGGWQDQFGGVFGGIKLVESKSGIQNDLTVKKLPSDLWTRAETKDLWLLYYTGVTRVAKHILSDIVRNMFLNNADTLDILNQIKNHAYTTSDAIQRDEYENVALCVKESWHLNRTLDSGISSPEIDALLKNIDDFALGYKLAGAGSGGYMLICAKDDEAVHRIKRTLNDNPINERGRFVQLGIANNGLQITRS